MFLLEAAYAMGAAPQGGGDPTAAGMSQLVMFGLMFVIFYFLLIRPQQKRAKEHKAMISALKIGDYVLTSGGIIGKIVEMDQDTLTLDLGNSTARFGRSFVSGLATNSPLVPQKEAKSGHSDKKKAGQADKKKSHATEKKAAATEEENAEKEEE